jgi:opacity protein-like surface antigen
MMSKRYFIFCVIAAVLAVAATPAPAAESYLNVVGGVGAGYYYLYPKDTQLQDFYRGGITYRAFLGLKAESGLSIMGDIGYYSEGNRSALAPYGTALTIIPITASVAYSFLKDSSISPYLGAGVGIDNINESDPDFTYATATRFSKSVFAGLDLYFDRNTVLRAELRQTFVDPVNSTFYYQANFGGLTASIGLAAEGPFFGGKKAEPPASVAPSNSSFSNNEYNAIMNHLDNIDSYYYQQNYWNRTIYQPWNTPNVYINLQQPTQQQFDEQKVLEEKNKIEQEQKRQSYTEQKLQLRREKKETVNPAR